MKEKIGEKHGFAIFINYHKPKTKRGIERIWISIRQPGEKEWRISESLNYVSGADILFVKKVN